MTSGTWKKTRTEHEKGRRYTRTKEWGDENAERMEKLWMRETDLGDGDVRIVGSHLEEVVADLDIGKDTYYIALEMSEKFAEASERGRAKSNSWWSKQTTIVSVRGKKTLHCPKTLMFVMQNKADWAVHAKHEIAVPSGLTREQQSFLDRNDLKEY